MSTTEPVKNEDLFTLLDLHPNEQIDQFDNTAVRDALHKNPYAAKTRRAFSFFGHMYPIVAAICLGATKDVIETMYRICPEAVCAIKNPLYLACNYNAPLDVIELLIEKYPKALRDERNVYGWTALHCACHKNASVDVVRLLIDNYPDALDVKARFGQTPLHLACLQNGSPSLIRMLVDGFPPALRVQDFYGQTPLHLASIQNAPIQVLRLLLERFPDALRVESHTKKRPLDCLCGSLHYLFFEEKDLSCQMEPMTSRIWKRNGVWDKICLFLHVMNRRVVLQDVNTEGEQQCALLAIYAASAISSPNVPFPPIVKNVVDCKLSHIAKHVCMHDNDDARWKKRLLICAIANGVTWENGLEDILKAYPEALSVYYDESGCLPFMIAASLEDANLSTIYHLLQSWPELPR